MKISSHNEGESHAPTRKDHMRSFSVLIAPDINANKWKTRRTYKGLNALIRHSSRPAWTLREGNQYYPHLSRGNSDRLVELIFAIALSNFIKLASKSVMQSLPGFHRSEKNLCFYESTLLLFCSLCTSFASLIPSLPELLLRNEMKMKKKGSYIYYVIGRVTEGILKQILTSFHTMFRNGIKQCGKKHNSWPHDMFFFCFTFLYPLKNKYSYFTFWIRFYV